jgi:hypothetical protein
MSNVKQSNRKVKTTKTGAKRGRPSKIEILERKVRGLTHENDALRCLCQTAIDNMKQGTQDYLELREGWEKLISATEQNRDMWKTLYLTIRDILYEDGMSPETYLSRKSIALRFSSQYRMN